MHLFRKYLIKTALCATSIALLATRVAIFAQTPAALTVSARTAELNRIFTDYWEDRLKHNPEFASALGDRRFNDQLSDLSPRAFNLGLERQSAFLVRLGAVDLTGLSTQDRVSAELLERTLIEDQEAAKFKEWEMPINQFNGPQNDYADLANNVPLETVKDYDDYTARLKKLPDLFRQVVLNMQSGIDDHRVQPAYLMEKVLVQVQTIASQKPEDSPFALPLKKFPASIPAASQKRIREEMLAAIQDDVLPTFSRFGRFLTAQAIPAGRKEPGVSNIPNGDAYYAFCVRRSTTTARTPAEIHQIGLDEVKRDEAEMLVIAKKMGYTDLKAFGAAIKADPKQHPQSGAQLLDLYRHYESQMKAKLPELFGRLPKAPFEVAQVPAYAEKDQAAAYYNQGTPDGSRPGRIYVNTYAYAGRSLGDAESIAYHEGLPGHHLQISIAQEMTTLPAFRQQSYYTAYTEGWGLYSERLGKDVGFYQDPYSDFGRLQGDIWRAIRLVVDTGVHSQHWTRQQMVDFFHDHSNIDEANIQAETDRYIAWPAQALGYKMGQLKMIELRERAKRELGPKFDIRGFHDTLLGAGAVPLDVLEDQVNAWIAATKGKP